MLKRLINDRRWFVRLGSRRNDEGAVLVIYTLAIVSVLLFAAVAIDLGNDTQTKQHAQNAADAVAVSAVWDLASIIGGGSAASAETAAIADVYAYIQHNYSSVSTPFGANACGAYPSGVSAGSSTTNCIGFFPASNPTGIYVAIPPQTVNYTFARVGGLTSQNISAFAEASLQNSEAGFELPYGFPATQQVGLQCLKTGSGMSANNLACTGSYIGPGNFAEIFSPRYLDYPGIPNGGGTDPVIMADIDLGIDHALNLYSSGTLICDYNGNAPRCGSYNSTAPYNNANGSVTDTGQTLNESGPGLYTAGFSLDGCNFTVPRLNHADGFQASGNCATDNTVQTPTQPWLSSADSFGNTSQELNGVHVSAYLINGTSSTAYTSCYQGFGPPGDTSPKPGPGATGDAIDAISGGSNVWSFNAAEEDSCLSNYIITDAATAASGCGPFPPAPACPAPIFNTSIVQSPRFGVVPVLNPVSGKKGAPILNFYGVFLYNASGHGNKVDAIDAWIFPLWMVKTGPVPGAGGGGLFTQGPISANLCSLTATPNSNC